MTRVPSSCSASMALEPLDNGRHDHSARSILNRRRQLATAISLRETPITFTGLGGASCHRIGIRRSLERAFVAHFIDPLMGTRDDGKDENRCLRAPQHAAQR